MTAVRAHKGWRIIQACKSSSNLSARHGSTLRCARLFLPLLISVKPIQPIACEQSFDRIPTPRPVTKLPAPTTHLPAAHPIARPQVRGCPALQSGVERLGLRETITMLSHVCGGRV